MDSTISPAPACATLGIQLGSSNYRVAHLQSVYNVPEILRDAFGNEVTPSYYGIDGAVQLFGDDALRYASIHPETCIRGIVKYFSDAVALPAKLDSYNVDNRLQLLTTSAMKPVGVLNGTIQALTDGIKEGFDQSTTIVNVVVAVANLHLKHTERHITEALSRHLEFLSLHHVTVIPKTAAALLGCGMNREACEDGVYVVLVVGAAVSELAVYQVKDGIARRQGGIYQHQIGGDMFDQAIVRSCCIQFEKEHGIDLRQHSGALQQLRVQCQKAKDRLSAAKLVPVEVLRLVGDKKLKYQVTRSELDVDMQGTVSQFSSWLGKTTYPFRKSLTLKEVIFVGGASRIPQLQRAVSEIFPGLLRTSVSAYAHLAVVNGATYWARYLCSPDAGLTEKFSDKCIDFEAVKAGIAKQIVSTPQLDQTAGKSELAETTMTGHRPASAPIDEKNSVEKQEHCTQCADENSIPPAKTESVQQPLGTSRKIPIEEIISSGATCEATAMNAHPQIVTEKAQQDYWPEHSGRQTATTSSAPAVDFPSIVSDNSVRVVRILSPTQERTSAASAASGRTPSVRPESAGWKNANRPQDDSERAIASRKTDALPLPTIHKESNGDQITEAVLFTAAEARTKSLFEHPLSRDITFEASPIFRQSCLKVSEFLVSIGDREETHRGTYSAEVTLVDDTTLRVYALKIKPTDKRIDAVSFSKDQIEETMTRSVFGGRDMCTIALKLRCGDPRNMVNLKYFELFFIIHFPTAIVKENFIRAMHDCGMAFCYS
ncbi:uncharacterized protein LOC129594848 [Paramacrobiotus metropolitanus]|uniref:uncharacterized protein LOC129594848 n=1 Tax=Paramacrobiotus metropolitanus TaxID=2943436 RepID=UPI002445F066|nr:uncharacterized protein LOC129594848 [Paramacrobiotus metropolitanus]XP_055347674.1 uncharacterized protein LOC129594848 [Paramacrobiotus metropolitanus]